MKDGLTSLLRNVRRRVGCGIAAIYALPCPPKLNTAMGPLCENKLDLT